MLYIWELNPKLKTQLIFTHHPHSLHLTLSRTCLSSSIFLSAKIFPAPSVAINHSLNRSNPPLHPNFRQPNEVVFFCISSLKACTVPPPFSLSLLSKLSTTFGLLWPLWPSCKPSSPFLPISTIIDHVTALH